MTPSREYLAQYGLNSFVGRFDAAQSYERGQRVVLKTPRGTELGTILCDVAPQASPDFVGEVLHSTECEAPDHEFAQEILATAEREASGLPLVFVDVEVLHERSQAILHVLPLDACETDALLEAWSARFGLPVRLLDLSQLAATKDPIAKSSCGSDGCGSSGGGCGTEKGGCSSGNCSRGAVKSAGELTAYFSDLREKMEAETAYRLALN